MKQPADFTLLGSSNGLAAGLEKEKSMNTKIHNSLKMSVFGAHPDDPETGCGGTMLLWSDAGHEVIAAYLTKGEAEIAGKACAGPVKIRIEEAKKACQLLNVRPAFLNQIDGACEVNTQRYDEVYQFLEREKPDIVLTHWPIDTHRDHRICSLLVYDAWLRIGRRFSLYYYEVMSGQQSQNFSPTDYVDIGSVVQRKHEACFVHESQMIKEMYNDSHGRMEIFRGYESGCKYAEAFIRHAQNGQMALK
jgi:LmbE family N-acetylglucosaminyl deacetylase